jgi:hypothetical protein
MKKTITIAAASLAAIAASASLAIAGIGTADASTANLTPGDASAADPGTVSKSAPAPAAESLAELFDLPQALFENAPLGTPANDFAVPELTGTPEGVSVHITHVAETINGIKTGVEGYLLDEESGRRLPFSQGVVYPGTSDRPKREGDGSIGADSYDAGAVEINITPWEKLTSSPKGTEVSFKSIVVEPDGDRFVQESFTTIGADRFGWESWD